MPRPGEVGHGQAAVDELQLATDDDFVGIVQPRVVRIGIVREAWG